MAYIEMRWLFGISRDFVGFPDVQHNYFLKLFIMVLFVHTTVLCTARSFIEFEKL
jgi:cytochrome c biogenesis protein ResB